MTFTSFQDGLPPSDEGWGLDNVQVSIDNGSGGGFEPPRVGSPFSIDLSPYACATQRTVTSLTPTICAVTGVSGDRADLRLNTVGTCRIDVACGTNHYSPPLPPVEPGEQAPLTGLPTNGGVGQTFVVPTPQGICSSPLALTSLTPTVCTVSGQTISLRSAGTCRVAVERAATANCQAARDEIVIEAQAVQPPANAIQTATGYQAGGTTSINNTLNYPAGQTLLSLVWRPRLPAGWTLTGANGDGTPQVNGNEILFSGGALTANPLRFSYQVAVPAGTTGAQSVAATVEYQWSGMANPATLAATPDPLTLTPGSLYHRADYQDPRWRIDATEASRVLAYWRSTGYHADAAGADGYAPGAGATAGTRHTADYQDPAWKIDATEASRVLAYWRANGYHADPAGADGYAPGAAATTASALPPATAATATQRLLGIPRAGGTVELELTLTAPAAPLSALARLRLPAGWTLTAVSGDGGPSLDPNDPTLILWTGQTLPATLRARVTLAVPAGAAAGEIATVLEGFLSDGRSYTAEAQPGPLPLALDTRLITIPEIAGTSGSARHFRIRVPDGRGQVTVRTQGASGEVDLYVRHGTAATPTAFDCRSATPGSNETCVIDAPVGGDYDLLLEAGGDYDALSLLVSWPQP